MGSVQRKLRPGRHTKNSSLAEEFLFQTTEDWAVVGDYDTLEEAVVSGDNLVGPTKNAYVYDDQGQKVCEL